MKKFIFLVVMALGAIVFSCQKEEIPQTANDFILKSGELAEINCINYVVGLNNPNSIYAEETNTSTFLWSFYNGNPGNGLNGTSQDLYHVSLDFFMDCEGASLVDNLEDIISLSYRTAAGGTWSEWSSAPIVYVADPSNDCSEEQPVIKIDQGTSDTWPVEIKLVLNGNYPHVYGTTMYFKAGTLCCSQTISGPGCKTEETDVCAYSQGLFLKSPHEWPVSTVTIGGYEYTEAEARAIADAKNKGGIADSKKAFMQAVAILLSNELDTGVISDPDVQANMDIINAWLSSLDMLAPDYLPNQTDEEILLYGDAAKAAGWIGDWIEENHCYDVDPEEAEYID